MIYENEPAIQVIELPEQNARLELDVPQFDFRDDGNFRMGMHLTGQLFVDGFPGPLVFDAWVHLQPVLKMEGDKPIGILEYVEVEDVTPEPARQAVEDAFGPDGLVGGILADLEFDVFEELAKSLQKQIFPDQEEDEFEFDAFSYAFYLGKPAPIRHPYYKTKREGDDIVPELEFVTNFSTAPALIASIALNGEDATPPDASSIVIPDTGLALLSSKRMFDTKFELEKEEIIGSKMQGLTMDVFEAESTDYGFDIKGGGHKTGATVTFEGSLIGDFIGGVGGQFVMHSTIETDVDTKWWVDLLSAVAFMIPVLGWILGEIYIWEPAREAPENVESTLLDKFSKPLQKVADDLGEKFEIPDIRTHAYLADAWFFNGNMIISSVAFAGVQEGQISRVDRDIAYLARDPKGEGKRSNRRRTVESVGTIYLKDGRAMKPWHAGKLVLMGILELPGYHAVMSDLVKEGVYLRGNPDGDPSNNLLD